MVEAGNMDMHTQEITVEFEEPGALSTLECLKVSMGMREGGNLSMIASHNRMAGERIFFWLHKRAPRSVFEGFLGAARRNGLAE
jgi:hypothetical protein